VLSVYRAQLGALGDVARARGDGRFLIISRPSSAAVCSHPLALAGLHQLPAPCLESPSSSSPRSNRLSRARRSPRRRRPPPPRRPTTSRSTRRSTSSERTTSSGPQQSKAQSSSPSPSTFSCVHPPLLLLLPTSSLAADAHLALLLSLPTAERRRFRPSALAPRPIPALARPPRRLVRLALDRDPLALVLPGPRARAPHRHPGRNHRRARRRRRRHRAEPRRRGRRRRDGRQEGRAATRPRERRALHRLGGQHPAPVQEAQLVVVRPLPLSLSPSCDGSSLTSVLVLQAREGVPVRGQRGPPGVRHALWQGRHAHLCVSFSAAQSPNTADVPSSLETSSSGVSSSRSRNLALTLALHSPSLLLLPSHRSSPSSLPILLASPSTARRLGPRLAARLPVAPPAARRPRPRADLLDQGGRRAPRAQAQPGLGGRVPQGPDPDARVGQRVRHCRASTSPSLSPSAEVQRADERPPARSSRTPARPPSGPRAPVRARTRTGGSAAAACACRSRAELVERCVPLLLSS